MQDRSRQLRQIVFRRFRIETTLYQTVLYFLSLFIFLNALSSSAKAQDLLYSIDSTVGGQGIGLVQFPSTNASPLVDGTRVSVPLSNGQVVGGEIYFESTDAPLNAQTLLESTSTKIISLDNAAGTVELHLYNGIINGMTIFETETDSFSRVVLDSSNSGRLLEQNTDQYRCADMPVDNTPQQAPFDISEEFTPSLTTVQNLESSPGAPNVIYIDYWGGSITVAGDGSNVWNANYGDPMNYEAYSIDATLGAFSAEERYRMYHAWLEAAEDYAPFNVNVTTKTSVYTATPIANRSRIIGTNTATRNLYGICGGACGGVAYVPSFGSNYYNTGFTFNSAISSMGMTHSHESGHQMGLGHDGGAANPNYYSGHGSWGPVMGAPFGKPYVQWSKGDYPGANNMQDDHAIIDAQLGTNADDISPGFSVSLDTAGVTQVLTHDITPTGFNGGLKDEDVFEIDLLSGGGTINLEVAPRFGVDYSENPTGETNGANLAMRARLYDSALNIVASEVATTTDLPNTNVFSYIGSLPADYYYLHIDALSPDTNWTTGWDEWGHGGEYQLTSTITAISGSSPEITNPVDGSTLTGPNQTFNFTSNGFPVESAFELTIGSTSEGSEYYSSGLLGITETEHFVANLPTDGSTIYVTLHYQFYDPIGGGDIYSYVENTYTAATVGAPYVTAPLPDSQLSSISETFYWNNDGVTATNWHVYLGSAPGQRNYYNSGGLPASTSSVTVTGLPSDGRDLYLRLWYLQATASWQYVDTHYFADASSSTPTITAPWPGANIGDSETVYWNPNAVAGTVERWRVYAGSTYGGTDFTFTPNLPTGTFSYTITGWPATYSGGQVWVRLLWRIGGVWSRTNELYVAGDAPSAPEDNTAPVDP